MEAAIENVRPLKRVHSLALLPPDMSELRVVLLGNSWSERNSVGNFILGKFAFNPEEEPDCCSRVQGPIKEKHVILIHTPDLIHGDISEDKLKEHVDTCMRLSKPGPHVFLLVLQPEDFTEEQKLRLCRVLELFNPQSLNQSLLLISAPRKKGPGSPQKLRLDQPLKDMIVKCRYRYLRQENTDLPELLTRLGQTAVESSREHGSSSDLDVANEGLLMKPKSDTEHMKPVLNLVLCGHTAVARAILGGADPYPVSSSSERVKHQVCGRWVSLVKLPALSSKPLEEVMKESLRCVSFFDPEGVHVFILVLPVGPLTDEDKKEFETIKNTFGSQVKAFTMILFTVETDPSAPEVVNYLQKDKDIQELIRRCGGGHCILNVKEALQVSEIFNAVEKMTDEGSRCFTRDMFNKAQMEKVVSLKAELQNVKQRSDDKNQGREGLRMVLIGKSKSGKTTIANAILGKDVFETSQRSSVFKTATGDVDGQSVTVVDTPALNADDFQQQIRNCFSMLAPGPHAFLLVLPIENLTQAEENSIKMIKKAFGKKSKDFIIIVFTKADDLMEQPLQSYLEGCGGFVKKLMNDFEGRYQVFSNRDATNHKQVRELLEKINVMVRRNGGCYNTEWIEDVDEFIKIHMQKFENEKEKEMQSMEDDLKRTIKDQTLKIEQERKQKAEQLKEKDDCINKERELRKREREEQERAWKKREEALRQEWKKKVEDKEKMAQLEKEQRENAEKKLDLCRREMKRDREAWDKERNDLWERIHQEDKQNLMEVKASHQNLQKEYHHSLWTTGKWTFLNSVILLVLLLLIIYVVWTHRPGL